MRDLADLTMDLSRLRRDQAPWLGPLAIVELGDEAWSADAMMLPPCPVIGIGDPGHPFAGVLDAVIAPPFSIETLAAQVLAQPMAAAVTVDLLRTTAGMPAEQALVAESLAYAALQGSAAHREWVTARDRSKRVDEGRVTLAREGGRLTVTLADPAHGNAIDRAMRDGLYDAFAPAALDPEIGTVALRAEGRSFSLGAELSEFGTTSDPAEAHRIRRLTLPARMAALCADRLDVHVQGACVGAGLELAAWGRRVTASADAWFQLPELGMGILPGAGGCVSLPRRIGRQNTALLVLTGKRINVRQALALGLVDEVADGADQRGADVG